MNEAETLLMDLLVRSKIIHYGFVGQVVIHVGQGGSISDIERHEKSLRRLLTPEKEVLKNGKMG